MGVSKAKSRQSVTAWQVTVKVVDIKKHKNMLGSIFQPNKSEKVREFREKEEGQRENQAKEMYFLRDEKNKHKTKGNKMKS